MNDGTTGSSRTPVFKSKSLDDTRDWAQQRRDLEPLFAPRAVAVVGASARKDSVGQAVFRNLLSSGYTGVVYPINPKHRSILGVRSYANVLEVDDDLDLVVIAVPASAIPQVLDECAQKGVRSAIVLSAGFKETGAEGAVFEEEMRKRAEKAGIALLGPNCLGLINTDPAVSMNATFARVMAAPGHVAFLSQSGALCTSILDYARAQHIGFSKFISFGNKADIDEIDLLRYLATDAQTSAILMYVEELSEGPRFIHLAREITGVLGKPILAIKTGRTQQGASAASSHTGSLAGADAAYDAIMAQAGVLRVDTVQELFDYAMAFGSQPMPRGDRIAIITNAGGPGIMATDACVYQGLNLAEFSEETTAKLKAALPAAASNRNPVDLVGDARSDRYRAALEVVLKDRGVDGVIAILTPQNMTDIDGVAEVIAELAQQSSKPLFASFMGGVDIASGVQILRRNNVPHYPFPEGAARVFAAMWRYQRWLDRPRTEERIFEVDRKKVNEVFAKAASEGRTQLPESEAVAVLEAYGFPTLRAETARASSDVEGICARLGFPLVMKIASPDILHKTDVGGVVLGIKDAAAAEKAFNDMMTSVKAQRPEANIWGVHIQQMAVAGREVILGATRDARFGPLPMFGLGGIYTEALGDVTFRLAPLRALSARRMVEQIRGRKILTGTRGQGPVDFEVLQECLERLSQLVIEFPVIKEIDINPLIAYEEGAVAADARIILEG
jgi:acetate---CoA ligase (ADP-forming)